MTREEAIAEAAKHNADLGEEKFRIAEHEFGWGITADGFDLVLNGQFKLTKGENGAFSMEHIPFKLPELKIVRSAKPSDQQPLR